MKGICEILEQVDFEAERERARKEAEKEREEQEKQNEKQKREAEAEKNKREREREKAKNKLERDRKSREKEDEKREAEKEQTERERDYERNRKKEERDREEAERKRAERERMSKVESMIQFGPYMINESSEVDTIVITGRFQPFTEGHLKVYKSVKKVYRHVIVGMATRTSPVIDKKNPFTDDEREKLIKKAIPGVKVARVPSLYYEAIWDAVGKEVAIGIGADREGALQKMGGAKDGSGKFEYYVIPRPSGAVSATMVRQSLLDDDQRLFKKIVPRGMHSEYDWMRERLLEVNE